MTIRDTTKDHPLEKLVTASEPGGIIAQEQRGVRELVRSSQLPTKGLLNDRAHWEALGIKILDADPGTTSSKDPLFCNVELPEGWTKRATDHHMWSELLDEKNVVRATIFYKAAFYDRDAFICRADK